MPTTMPQMRSVIGVTSVRIKRMANLALVFPFVALGFLFGVAVLAGNLALAALIEGFTRGRGGNNG